MNTSLQPYLTKILGLVPSRITPLNSGCIGEVYRVDLPDHFFMRYSEPDMQVSAGDITGFITEKACFISVFKPFQTKTEQNKQSDIKYLFLISGGKVRLDCIKWLVKWYRSIPTPFVSVTLPSVAVPQGFPSVMYREGEQIRDCLKAING